MRFNRGLRRAFVLIGAAGLCGCASHKPLVLDTVGPPPATSTLPGTNGSLVVFSARQPNPDFNGLPYRDRHTDYKIFADGKQVLETVRNDDRRLVGSPKKVDLPVGAYRVQARANGYGLVTVPVVIKPHQVTAVHLEGSYWWPRGSGIFEDDPVRLPSGEIAGWRVRQVAKPRKSRQTATKRQRDGKQTLERRAIGKDAGVPSYQLKNSC